MKSECVTIQYLKQLSAAGKSMDSAGPVSIAAASALKIISDIKEYRMTETDMECLHMLVDTIFQKGHGQLLPHLREGAPDCNICSTLAARMRLHEAEA